MTIRYLTRASTLAVLLLAAVSARATMPVIDVAAIGQLIQQIMAWEQQLEGMRSQLDQLQQTKAALTGSRGMAQLLLTPLSARNYLPADAASLRDLASAAAGANTALQSEIATRISANSILPPAGLQSLPTTLRSLLEAERRAVAESQVLSGAAYSHSSDRFAALSALIDRISATPDAKAIAELQGRIEAEQAMLTNESIKLAAMAQLTAADRDARDVARRESVSQAHGRFASRFQPKPPVP
ncbi:MAG: type IV secretion system protein [Proteobacteria bacterium]|nr:type IV secretion system protein [Pseudomonadota bacterium]